MNDAPLVISAALPDAAAPLFELPPMDLPYGAVLNDDGTVTLTLEYPCEVKLRTVGSQAAETLQRTTELTFHRLTGADVRKMSAAKSHSMMAMALSSGLGLGKLNLLQQVMDARDEAAAAAIVSELLGGLDGGLPQHAEETPEGITLPLWQSAEAEDGTVHPSITFKRITAMQRRQASEAPNLLDWGIGLALGITPKVAKSLVDSMDGADAVAASQVLLFLSGNGPRAGK